MFKEYGFTVLTFIRGGGLGPTQEQLFSAVNPFPFHPAQQQKVQSGRGHKKQGESICTPPLTPLPILLSGRKTGSNCLCVTGGICGEPEKSCPATPSQALLTLPAWKEQGNKQMTGKMILWCLRRGNNNVTTCTDPAGVCRHRTTRGWDSSDRKMLLQELQLPSHVHSCHTSRANMRNCDADRSCALAHTQFQWEVWRPSRTWRPREDLGILQILQTRFQKLSNQS